jgi:RHS repeat-associated protein
VFVETEYDLLGRVKRTSNPYRLTDLTSGGVGKIWTQPRYDAVGRVFETCTALTGAALAPTQACPAGTSTGITQFDISSETGYVGTTVTTTDASGRKSRSLTNALGQLVRVDEPSSTNTLEPLPQATPTPNPVPSPTPGGGQHQCTVNCFNNLNGNEYGSLSTYYVYNAQGQMVKVMQGGQTRYFKYDSLGRLIRVRQPEQEPNDHLDLADSFNTSGKWTAAFAYDVLGNLRRTTDANGVNVINEYDKAKRAVRRCYTKPQIQTSATACVELTGAQLSADTPSVTFFYDGFMAQSQPPTASPNFAKGKLTFVNNGISQTRYLTFDNLGRLTSSEQKTPVGDETMWNAPARVSLYEYNFAGALVKETYPSGRVVQNQFEADGDLMRVFGKANSTATEKTYANSFSYTASGGISQLKLGNGRWETAKFNERLQLTELGLGYSSADASLWKVNYDYGEFENGSVNTNKNTGNIARQTLSFVGLQTPIVQTYKYDSLERLIEAKETSGTATNAPQNWIQNFGYDRFGNRISFNQQIGQTTVNQTPAIDANTNRFSGTQFGYDKNGNLTTDIDPLTSLSRTFIFNGDNKQTEVKNSSGTTIGRYSYDGEGNRVKKETATETTVFVYSAGKLIAEYSTQTIPQNERTTSYTTEDHLGSPRIITDALGQVKSRRDFMPFGEDLTINVGARSAALKYGTSDNIRQRFTGYEKDSETQLDFAEARMYENRHGRFTAVDPLLASGKSANPQTFNRFVYVGNNPINITDPLGLDWYSRYDEEAKKTRYRWSADNKTFKDGSSVDGWTAVEFSGLGFSNFYHRLDDVSIDGKEAGTIYLNRYGGYLTQEQYDSYARVPIFDESFSTFAYNMQVGRLVGTGQFLADTFNNPFGVPSMVNNLTGYGLVPRPEYRTNSQAFSGIPTYAGLAIGTAFIGGGAGATTKVGSFGSGLINRVALGLRPLKGVSQIRPNGSINTLVGGGQFGQTANKLVVTENHLKDLKFVFSTYNGKLNFFSRNYWKHVLPHRHIYQLRNPPSMLNNNWRNTFTNQGATKRTIFIWEAIP